MSSILEAIAAFRKENNDRWDSNCIKLDEVQSEIKSVKVEVVLLKAGFEEVKTKCKEACDSVDAMKIRNEELSEELAAVKLQVLDLEQHSRKSNILISGVPVTTKENMYDVLATIAGLLNLNFHPADISTAHRLQGGRGDKRPPSIVVAFVSRDTKALWLAARRKKGSLAAQELVRSFPNTPVYLNEHLTPQTRAIFNGARALVKSGKLASVWTSDCKVMAKLKPEHRPFRVKDLQHVTQLGEAPAEQPPVATDTMTPPPTTF